MERIHPMLVHFPIALILFGVLCDLLRVRLRGEQASLGLVGLWCTTAGTVMLIPVMGSGLLAQTFQPVPNEQVLNVLNWHERLSYILALWFGGLVGWRWDAFGQKPDVMPWGYRLAAALGAILIIGTASLGGELVYKHGMAVEKSTAEP